MVSRYSLSCVHISIFRRAAQLIIQYCRYRYMAKCNVQIRRRGDFWIKEALCNNMLQFTYIYHFFISHIWADCNVTWKIRPCSFSLSCLYKPMDIFLKLMLLDFVLLGFFVMDSDFPLQSKRCDIMYVLECLVSVPISAPLTQGATVANVWLEVESANTKNVLLAQRRSSTEPL